MEELLEEIARQLAENNEKQNAVLATKLGEIQTILGKMANSPTPTIKLNTSEISHEIKAHLNGLNIKVDNKEVINEIKRVFESENEFGKRANQAIREIREEKKDYVRVKFEKDFFGFSGWRPFLIYFFFIAFAFGFAGWSWNNNNSEKIKEANDQILNYQKHIELLRKSNPKTAEKFFY